MRGTVFHHEKMVFPDGVTGIKLLILLNFPHKDEPYLCVKTTSQQKTKPKTPGCIQGLSLFFIPAATSFFEKDTWVELYEIYPFAAGSLKSNPHVRQVGKLDKKLMDDILYCLFAAQGEDIPAIYRRLLKPPMQEALEKLQEKFPRTS